VSTLAHVLEAHGLATIALGSVKAQIEGTAPPRGLYCDFPLGRPLGRPADPAFQHQVLAHAFAMLKRTEAGVEEFPIAIHDEGELLACPIPPREDTEEHPAVAEARGLRPAYDRTIARYGERMGAFRLIGPDDVPGVVRIFADIAAGANWKEAGIPGVPARVVQDIRGYYEAAAVSLADHTPAAFEATRWFMRQTEAGKAILEARAEMTAQGAKQPIWQFLVSNAAVDDD
jgi:hypothetical protein